MKKILLATDRKFWHQEQGSAKRISDLYEYLVRKKFDVYIFFIGKITPTEIDSIKLAYNGEFKIFNKGSGFLSIDCDINARFAALKKAELWLKKKARPLKKLLLSHSSQVQIKQDKLINMTDFFSQEHQDYFRTICRELNPEVVIVEYLRIAYLVRDFDKVGIEALTLIDTHDVAHQRYQRFQANGEQEIKITEDQEKQLLSIFDVIIAIQSKDKETFQKMLPEHHVIQVSYACEPKKYEYLNSSPINITYVAGPNSSNKRAIADFLHKVWCKLVTKFEQKIQLNIVGKICEELTDVKIPANVKLTGWIDELETVYQEADIIINPVYFGTGLKIKNVEALSYSKPLVTTTIGAEGLEHGINKAFLVSDRPKETFEQLSTLITNEKLRKELSDKAYAFACQNFTEQQVYQELYQVLTQQNSNL
ncbi:glycosyl transferase group 1 [Gloeocapsa sp. PCC 7428]|uniref:glycosyltransferase family 4 protein n=1 Tax=Gloeocapsa sp. PCC 7428 TaxID=1173026 RepID=UPI0002A609C4|nr:glycosyltransferase family 4 protein [Gloeocapsa sp. PCC 7428]AFZ29879.1 glycosyl transferase group 1 [Gloeocapsa sp. PCC 7428]